MSEVEILTSSRFRAIIKQKNELKKKKLRFDQRQDGEEKEKKNTKMQV